MRKSRGEGGGGRKEEEGGRMEEEGRRREEEEGQETGEEEHGEIEMETNQYLLFMLSFFRKARRVGLLIILF